MHVESAYNLVFLCSPIDHLGAETSVVAANTLANLTSVRVNCSVPVIMCCEVRPKESRLEGVDCSSGVKNG